MPGVPEFIALPKAKEMFALSSWRDSPGIHGGVSGAAAGTQPSPLQSAADALRGGGKMGYVGAATHGSNHPSPGVLGSRAGQVPSPLPASDDIANGANGKKKAGTGATAAAPVAAATAATGNGRVGRKQRGGGAKASSAQQQQQLDVDDYFVHVYLPTGVAYQTFAFETQAQASPLRLMDVGMPIVLFPRRGKEGGKDGGEATPAPAAAVEDVAPANGKDGSRTGGPATGMRLSPFATPALRANPKGAKAANGAVPPPLGEEEGDGHEASTGSGGGAAGGFLLPPAEHTLDGTSSVSTPSRNATGPTSPSPIASAAGGVEDRYQASLLFAEKSEADKTAAFIQKRWPTALVQVVPRNRALLNASLVLKGLPSMNKTEYILEELENLPYAPSYVRVHRGERGVYKNVVFVKYADREAAEDSKVRLERVFVGTRPLKVEFKKKSKTQGSDSAAAAAAANVAVLATPGTHAAQPHAAGGAGAPHAEDEDGAAVAGADQVALQQMVRDLRVSTEHEGFAYKREDLTKGELKLLKQLCLSYGLLFDMTEAKVTVKRSLGGTLQGAGTHSAGPSPALRPHQPPPTPAWVPATPAPLRPMDFKGISHWKDIRGQQSTLGIMRPIGPEDGVPAFSAGRGRPI